MNPKRKTWLMEIVATQTVLAGVAVIAHYSVLLGGAILTIGVRLTIDAARR